MAVRDEAKESAGGGTGEAASRGGNDNNRKTVRFKIENTIFITCQLYIGIMHDLIGLQHLRTCLM
ncbi:hypothetical protein QJS04_geneDACA018762 [Acorus gramineus]|uniref:Uncharacterized protein n=1 Tax=Acorus gramineus TaxID=55184 RepID=A0AAV9ACG0_ACOGR|nr:hypothetical protein QJS04_geneDACA018762 [Acorus gramineus]